MAINPEENVSASDQRTQNAACEIKTTQWMRSTMLFTVF